MCGNTNEGKEKLILIYSEQNCSIFSFLTESMKVYICWCLLACIGAVLALESMEGTTGFTDGLVRLCGVLYLNTQRNKCPLNHFDINT